MFCCVYRICCSWCRKLLPALASVTPPTPRLSVARLGRDLNPAAPRTSVLGGIWILIDLDLLDGGRRNAQTAHFHAVDDDGRPAGAERPGVQEARQGRDDVLVHHRQTFEQVP